MQCIMATPWRECQRDFSGFAIKQHQKLEDPTSNEGRSTTIAKFNLLNYNPLLALNLICFFSYTVRFSCTVYDAAPIFSAAAYNMLTATCWWFPITLTLSLLKLKFMSTFWHSHNFDNIHDYWNHSKIFDDGPSHCSIFLWDLGVKYRYPNNNTVL